MTQHPTKLPRTLALLLFSVCLGWPQLSVAKDKKQAPLQCENNGSLSACPDSSASGGKPGQSASFKAQSDDTIEAPVKKKKSKKSEGKKKTKRSKTAEE